MRLTNTIRDAFILAVMQNVPREDYDAQVTKLVQDDIRVRELIVERPTLEDVFLARTGHGDIR